MKEEEEEGRVAVTKRKSEVRVPTVVKLIVAFHSGFQLDGF